MATLVEREHDRADVEQSQPVQPKVRGWSVTQAHGVIAVTVLAFLVPALWDLLSDPARPYGYLAADAFYYFTIATNWVRFGAIVK